jgi:hypothetical protein
MVITIDITIIREMNKMRRDFLTRIATHNYEDAIKLADNLKVDKDPLHIMQAVSLYEQGEDLAGDELAHKVRDTKKLSIRPTFLFSQPKKEAAKKKIC